MAKAPTASPRTPAAIAAEAGKSGGGKQPREGSPKWRSYSRPLPQGRCRPSALARRKAIYEEMHPETKDGGNRGNQHTGGIVADRQNGDVAPRFTKDAADNTGIGLEFVPAPATHENVNTGLIFFIDFRNTLLPATRKSARTIMYARVGR